MKSFSVGVPVGCFSDFVRAETLGIANVVVQDFVDKNGVRIVFLSDIPPLTACSASSFSSSSPASMRTGLRLATHNLMFRSLVPAQIVGIPLMSGSASATEAILAIVVGPFTAPLQARSGTSRTSSPFTHVTTEMLNDEVMLVTPDPLLSMTKSTKGDAPPVLGLKRQAFDSLSGLRAAVADLNDKMSDPTLAVADMSSFNLLFPLAPCKQLATCLLPWATKAQNVVLTVAIETLQTKSEVLEVAIPRCDSVFFADGHLDITYARQRIGGCPKKEIVKPSVRLLRAIIATNDDP